MRLLGAASLMAVVPRLQTGKQNLENTDIFVGDSAKRVGGRIQITTDSYSVFPAAQTS
jgi:hypothetical protein